MRFPVSNRPFGHRATLAVAPTDALESTAGALKLRDLAPDHHLDVGLSADPLDQILRHGLLERTAGDQRHPAGASCKEDCRLTGGIAAADQRNFGVRA